MTYLYALAGLYDAVDRDVRRFRAEEATRTAAVYDSPTAPTPSLPNVEGFPTALAPNRQGMEGSSTASTPSLLDEDDEEEDVLAVITPQRLHGRTGWNLEDSDGLD